GEASGFADDNTRKQWKKNLQQAYEIDPESPLVLNVLAHYHLRFDELSKAEEYTDAMQASSRYSERHHGMKLYWQLAEIAEKRGNLRLAEQHLQRAIQIHPDLAQPQTQLASFLAQNGRSAEAEALLTRWLGRFDKDLTSRWMLIGLARGRGDRQRVGQLLEDGVAVRPDDASLALELGLMYLEDRRLEPAADLLTHASRGRLDAEQRLRCLLPLARCLEVLGRKREAARLHQKIQQLMERRR
ncbi:MAG: tetratricopeptide repeat protein, partial [Planctomycetota bacterium]